MEQNWVSTKTGSKSFKKKFHKIRFQDINRRKICIVLRKKNRILILIVTLFIVCLGVVAGKKLLIPAYEKPVANYMEALEKKDFKKFKSLLPEFLWEDLGEDSVLGAEEYFEEICSTFPHDVKVKYKITKKYPLSEDDLNDMEIYMGWYTDDKLEITEGYDLMLQFTINGVPSNGEFTVIKINGKWYMNTGMY